MQRGAGAHARHRLRRLHRAPDARRMLEVLCPDYIRPARATGLPERVVVTKHVMMYFANTLVEGGSQAPLWIPTIAIALTAIGELIAWTSTYGLVTRAAPKGYASVAMGAWYFMTLGLGGYLAGVPGGWLASLGYGGTFLTIAAITGSAAILCLLLRGWYMRLANRAGVTL